MINTTELERIWKVAATAEFQVLYRHLLKGLRKTVKSLN